jgi:SAM-dependent MidA family methyltransferase
MNPLTTLIRERGPMTVAAFMELALYDPLYGYYTTRRQRSGAAGDFFTSVDVGSLFGEMLAVQIAQVWDQLKVAQPTAFDLVEVGAGNGRLALDILDVAKREFPACYDCLRVTLVERSAVAREAASAMLYPHRDKIAAICKDLPATVDGVVVANELLDAFPVHLLTMTPDGVREVYVTAEDHGGLEERIGPLSDARLEYAMSHSSQRQGCRCELSLEIPRWIHRLSDALTRGVVLCFDYVGAHRGFTLRSYSRHNDAGTSWLSAPGQQDITAHLDLDALLDTARKAGLEVVGCVDQTYFLISLGILDRLPAGTDFPSVRRRLAVRTLIAPGGLGSTMKAIGFGKGVDGVALQGFQGGRLT